MHKLLAFASRDLAFSFLVALIVPYEVVIFAFACINVLFLCCVSVRSLLHPLCKQSGCGYFLYFCCRIGCILLGNMSYVNLM